MRTSTSPDTDTPAPGSQSAGATLAGRLSARVYDPVLWLGERRGLRARRRELLAGARGLTLEIGGGTGLNLPLYPHGLERLVLAEPDAAMRARLSRRAASAGQPASVIDAGAEALPFESGSVDTVVSTLVLCTVGSPEAALREIARVLAPGGQLLFLEHVRAGSPRLSRRQDRLARPWRAFAAGCNCNRPTPELMTAAGFELEVREASWSGMPSIVRPLVYGRATRVLA